MSKSYRKLYAIVRYDQNEDLLNNWEANGQDVTPEDRFWYLFKLKKIVETETEAKEEVDRLNELKVVQDNLYFYVPTKMAEK